MDERRKTTDGGLPATNHKPLPTGWVWTTLGEVAELVGGGTPSREVAEYFTGNIVWLTPTEIPKDRVVVVSSSKERITPEALRRSSARMIPAGSVLMTSRASIGFVAIAACELTTNQGFASFVCSSVVHNGFLAYWLWANAEMFKQHATGTTFKEITKSKLRLFALSLPPLAEQRRIVARLEELLTRLDAGVQALKQVQAKLKRYKAAVLKAACEGRLVPQDPSDEPAEKLLARILAERRARWEADLRAKGKDPSKSNYAEPQPPNTVGQPELPVGWCWATVEQLAITIVDGTHHTPTYTDTGVAFISVKDIREGRITFDECKFISRAEHEQLSRRCNPELDDVLITKSGTIGRIAIVRTSEPFSLFVSVALIKTIKNVFPQEYFKIALEYYIQSINIQQDVKGGLIKNLHLEDLRVVSLRLPPILEQRRIVAEVERRLSVVQELEQTVAANLARAGRLRQAVLRRAFEGKLVPQDPSDEPAEQLLERIRASHMETVTMPTKLPPSKTTSRKTRKPNSRP